MGDSFVDSMYRGFQMSHMLENDRRERQEAQRQEMLRQAQMAKLAQALMQERAKREFLTNPPKEFEASVNNRMPGAMNAIRSGVIGFEDLPKEAAEKTPNIPLFVDKPLPDGTVQKMRYNPQTREHDIPFGSPVQGKDEATADIKKFEMLSGMDPAKRGTPEYRQKYLKYLNENKQAIHITTPRQGPDPEDQELKREQKRNLIAERKLKMKYGALPTLNTLAGETVYPTNPQTGKPFTQDEWAVVQQRAYEDVAGAAKPGSGGKGKQAEGLAGVPPAAKHRGRTIRDTKTGRRYKSNGSAWVEVK
jgi:hypothetical protein